MADLYIKNGKIYREGRFVQGSLLLKEGRISGYSDDNSEGSEEFDAEGLFVLPGLIDRHTHGGFGIDCNRASASDFRCLSRAFAKEGTSAWMASITADSEEATVRVLTEAARAIEEGSEGAELLGVHLEGPFLAEEYCGAISPSYLRCPDTKLIRRYQEAARGHLRSMTLAPELDGALELISACRHLGIRVSLGHSGASWQEAMEAKAAGADAVTHLGNAMRPFHHREPGLLGAALDSDFYAEIIADGVHSHPAFVRLAERMKGPDRLMLVTDSMMAAGMPDGTYRLGESAVTVRDKVARTGEGNLAGSTLSMVQALRKLKDFTGKALEDLIPYASSNAAAWLGVDDRKGRILPGFDADLLLLDESLEVRAVFCKGRLSS